MEPEKIDIRALMKENPSLETRTATALERIEVILTRIEVLLKQVQEPKPEVIKPVQPPVIPEKTWKPKK